MKRKQKVMAVTLQLPFAMQKKKKGDYCRLFHCAARKEKKRRRRQETKE
jgi:hypothetical protein